MNVSWSSGRPLSSYLYLFVTVCIILSIDFLISSLLRIYDLLERTGVGMNLRPDDRN